MRLSRKSDCCDEIQSDAAREVDEAVRSSPPGSPRAGAYVIGRVELGGRAVCPLACGRRLEHCLLPRKRPAAGLAAGCVTSAAAGSVGTGCVPGTFSCIVDPHG